MTTFDNPAAEERYRFLLRSSRRALAVMCLMISALIWPGCCDAKEVLPPPTYENTFYLFFNDGYRGSQPGATPYEEGWPSGGLPLEYQLLKLKEMLSRMGPDGPYLRIGVADVLRPFDTVDPDQDWEYVGLAGLNGSGDHTHGHGGDLLRGGEDPYFNAVIIKSWALVDVPGMLFVNSLTQQRWQILNDSLAVPKNLVAYLEMQPEAVQRYDDDRICIADDGDGEHTPSDFAEDIEFNGNPLHGTELTLSRLMPTAWREGYIKRNFQAAIQHLLEINRRYPGLIVAASCDSEFDMNSIRCEQGECDYFADFNPLAIEEWRQWLSHTGLYGSGGEYEGQGAEPWFSDLEAFNEATGSSFSSWDEVDPRSTEAGDTLWAMYLDGGDMDGEWSPGNPPGSGRIQGWCEVMIENRCEDTVDWLLEIAQGDGWTADQVFTHQIPGGFTDEALNDEWLPFWGYEHRLATLAATDVDNGRPGITGFRETTLNLDLFRILHEEISPDGSWSNLEFNPIRAFEYFPGYDNDYDLWMDAYKKNWEWGAHVLSPFRWWVPPEASTSWANIRPDYHTENDPTIDFEARLIATRDFVSDDVHRFRPWSSGGGSLDDEQDFLPPSPYLANLIYDGARQVVDFKIAPEIYKGCSRLLWYDAHVHELWPRLTNVFGWPEFTDGQFAVHRDTIPDFTPSIFNLLANVEIPEFSYRDTALPATAPLFYSIVAVDNQGDRSPDPTRAWIVPELSFHESDSLIIELQTDSQKDTVIAVSNTGQRPLSISEVLSDSEWIQVSGFPNVLLPGMVDSIHLMATSHGLETGEHATYLSIRTNDPFSPDVEAAIILNIPLGGETAGRLLHRLTLSPQPAAGQFMATWQCGEPRIEVRLELVDVGGRAILRKRGFTDEQGVLSLLVDPPNTISSGVYFVRVAGAGREVQKEVILLK